MTTIPEAGEEINYTTMLIMSLVANLPSWGGMVNQVFRIIEVLFGDTQCYNYDLAHGITTESISFIEIFADMLFFAYT